MDPREDLSDREEYAAGALIGTFVGDALGMPVEGWSHRRIRKEFGELDRMLDARRGAGTYTDDTQMMIATAKSLLAEDGVDRKSLARAFLDHHEPDRGYGRGTTMVFEKWKGGVPVSEAAGRIYNGGSFGNGGSMRIAPVGIFCAVRSADLVPAVRDACGVTHAHPLGIGASYLQAFSVARAFEIDSPAAVDPVSWVRDFRDDLPKDVNPDQVLTGKLKVLEDLLNSSEGPQPPRRIVDHLGVTSRAFESVPASVYSFLAHRNSFRDALVYAVGLGGDTDTIGAMTGALAGACHGVSAVPGDWWEALENGPDGRDDVVDLARRIVNPGSG